MRRSDGDDTKGGDLGGAGGIGGGDLGGVGLRGRILWRGKGRDLRTYKSSSPYRANGLHGKGKG